MFTSKSAHSLNVSNEKRTGYLLYIGDYTTQFCGDYNRYGSLWTHQDSMECHSRFFLFSFLRSHSLPNHQVSPRTKAQPAECKLQCGRWASEFKGALGGTWWLVWSVVYSCGLVQGFNRGNLWLNSIFKVVLKIYLAGHMHLWVMSIHVRSYVIACVDAYVPWPWYMPVCGLLISTPSDLSKQNRRRH